MRCRWRRRRSSSRAWCRSVQAVEQRPIRDALGRVLARDIVSASDVPAHDNSAMDGFALRGAELLADATTRLRIVGSGLAGQNFSGDGARTGLRAHHHRRGHAGRAGHGGAAGIHPDRRRACAGAAGAAAQRRQPAPGRRGPGPRRGRAGRGPAAAPGRPGAAGLAGPGRGAGAAPAARGLLLHRRRTALDRRAAGRRLRLRQQPLHRLGHAAAPGRGSHRPGRGARRPGRAARSLHAGRRLRRRRHHLGRRQRRRGRPHQAHHGRAGRSAVLAHRHAARSADGDRAHRHGGPAIAGRSCSGCPATRWR